jgi:eukaryotic-like serine/threonine-protein kinase
LADFANKTGDSVFEGTLREGLSVQLDQSPFMSSISDQQVQQTLQMMGRRRDTSLTPEIAREVCQRTNSSAVVEGSIALIGKQYSLILKAVDCSTGESLASTQVQVGDKNEVLNGLGKSASDLRRRLGESRVTVEKFDAPLSQATTPSLEALQAYTLARKQFERGVPDDAIPFLKRAIELDPNFAVAYAALGADYANKDRELSTKYATKAFELSGNVSEHERLYISAVYYGAVTGELDKEIETLKLMTQTYPRDAWARFRLGSAYERAGELAPAVEEYRVAVSLDSQRPQCRHQFASLLLALNHLDEAKTAFEEAISNKTDDMDVHVGLYRIAYFRKDASGMQHELDWAAGNPDEFRLVEEQSEIALYEGRLERARELLQKSNDLAARRRLNTEIPLRTARHASYRALLGDCHEVRGNVPSTVTASSDTPALMTARALTFAVCGDKKQAQELIEEMIARFPKDSVTQSVRVPIVRAAVAIKDGNPDAAVEALRPAASYENRYPGIIYFRGQACLQAHKAAEAEAEFQRVLGYSPVVGERVGAIARLGLARAYVLGGDVAKAKAAYQDFLTFWKDADPDIPILNQAKAEYKTLH